MALPQAGVQLVADGLSQFTSDMGKANQAVAKFGETGASAGKDFDSGFGEIVTGALRKIGELGVEALLKAGQAVAGFVKDSVGLAGDFQQGMLEFQAVAGKGVDTKGLEQFHDLFIQLGKELPVSTSEVQQAAIEMVKGGIDPATVAAGGLRQNIQFAAAAMGGDLVQAATVSAKILGGWTSQSDSAADKAAFLTHATDQLTKAANASSVDVHELSLGIFNAQGIAKTAGVSFDDLTTVLAELSPRFASSSEAGNSLKNVIARLQPTTQPAIDAMQGLGLITEDGKNKFYDASGAFVGFEKASQVLQDSLVGLTQQQKQAVLQTIFGNDAMNAASALAELGAKGYTDMATALDQANGVQANAALKQQGFNTALENAKGSVEALQITIGSALLPVLTDLLNNVVAPAVNTLTDMADAIFGSDEAFSRLSPTAQAVVHVIDVLVADVQEIIGAFNDAGASSSEFGETIGVLAGDLGLPQQLIEDIVFGIQALVKWFGSASDEGNSLGRTLSDLDGIWNLALKAVQDVGQGYMAIAQSVLPIVQQLWTQHGTEIMSFLKTTYDQLISIIKLALQLYDAIVPPILNAVAQAIKDHATAIESVLTGAWQIINGVIDGALTLIQGILKVALDAIHGDWSKAWADLQAMSARVVQDIWQVIKGGLDLIAGLFDTSLQDILDTWKHNWDALVDLATNIDWAQVGDSVIEGIKQGMIDAWDSLKSWLIGRMKGLLDSALAAIDAGSPATEWMPVGQFSVQGIMQGFQDMWPSLTALVNDLGGDLVKQAQALGEQVQGAIADAFGATASIDRQLAQNLDKFKDILPQYQQYTQGALKQAEQEARAFLDPTEGAKYFKLRSNQILEYAKLQKDLADAQTQDEKDRIQQQMQLINAAQIAEINQFKANAAAAESPEQTLVAQIQALVSKLQLGTDTPVIAQLEYLLEQLQSPQANPYANPPATTQQMMGGNSYSYNRTVNMPIYTSQSPTVIQDSAAITWASMP